MSKVDRIIAAEANTLEETQLPDPPARPAQRPNAARSRMFSLRLGEDELAELDQLSAARGLPAHTLARIWLLDRLHTEQRPAAEPDLAELDPVLRTPGLR